MKVVVARVRYNIITILELMSVLRFNRHRKRMNISLAHPHSKKTSFSGYIFFRLSFL